MKLLWIVILGVIIAVSVTVYHYCFQEDDDTFGQTMHWEHQASSGPTKADQRALEDLIDHSPTREELVQAQAKLPSKYAVAMLELYGTPAENAWADSIVLKGKKP